MVEHFFLSFIPLFVAIDAPGVLPLFLSLTHGLTPAEKKKLITQATVTAFAISFVFILLGKLLFSFLGITENDFRIGGGIVLLVLAITDLLFSQQEVRRNPGANIGVVPIGIPLIMGPGALTAIIILGDTQGFGWTFASLIVNLAIVWFLFNQSNYIIRVIGEGGAEAFAKVASLFLAAIAVMMIRVGVLNILEQARLP